MTDSPDKRKTTLVPGGVRSWSPVAGPAWGLPADEAGDGGAEGGFENGGLAVADGDGHFAHGFVGGFLAGDAQGVGGAFWVVARGEFEGAVGFFGLVEEFGLGLAPLEGGKHGADIGESPFHDDLAIPIELFLTGLGGGIDEHGGFGGVEAKVHRAAVAAGVGLVDGVIGGAFGGAFGLGGWGGVSVVGVGGTGGGWFEHSVFHRMGWLDYECDLTGFSIVCKRKVFKRTKKFFWGLGKGSDGSDPGKGNGKLY